MDFFYYEFKFEIKFRRGEGELVWVGFFTNTPKLFFLRGVGLARVGRWTDRRTGPNQLAPSPSLKLGAKQ